MFNYLDNKALIVNSTNKYMMYGSNVCGTIYKLASKDFLEGYCKNNYSEYMKVNEVRITLGIHCP